MAQRRRRRQGALSLPRVTSGVRPSRPSGRLMFSQATWRLITRSLGLSQRQSQIVQALFDDEKEAAIAEHLGISPHTVHSHLERLYRKVGVTSRAALVRRIFAEYLSEATTVDDS